MKSFFNEHLRKVTIFAWFIKVLALPFQLILAETTAKLMSSAIDGEVGIVVQLSVFLLIIVLGYKIVDTILKVLYEKRMVTVQHECKMKLYSYCLDNPLSRLYTFEQGAFLEKLNDDFAAVVSKYTVVLPSFGADLLMSVVYFCFLAGKDWLLAVLLFGMALVQVLPPLIVKGFLQKNYLDCREIEAELTNLTLEGYRGFLELKMYHLREWYLDKIKAVHKEYLKIGCASIGAGAIEESMNTFIEYLLRYGACIVAGVLVLYGRIDLELGISAIVLSGSLFAAVKSLFSSIPNFAIAKTAEGRIMEWENDRTAQEQKPDSSEIWFKDVTYVHGEKTIFQEFNHIFHEDGVTVIKGENGIGKSTLLKLILGLLVPQQGSVTIGGSDVRNLSEENFPVNMFYLPQERIQMDVSVAEFIEMMQPEQESFCKMANIFGVEEAWRENMLPSLSGGEEKRLLLAMAFAFEPELLLLDEPMNSLDKEGRKALVEMVSRRKKSTLIVTHEEMFDGIADHLYIVKEGGICDGKGR